MSNKKTLHDFYSIVSATPSCVKLIDKDGLLIEMNPQGLSLIEADSLDSVRGANVYDIVEESHREKFKKFNEKICNGEKLSLVFEIISLKGTRRWMETFATPYKLDSGEIAHLAITNEITDRVNKQIELDKQRRMANHNAKLATIGEIAAGVGHEINNPLSIICAQLSMMENQLEDNEEELDKEKLLERISHCQKSVIRITNIVKGLRNFSRSDNENEELMNLSLILQESVDMLKEIYEKRNITINCNIQENIMIKGNIGRIQQVIMNLITNAKDAVADSKNKKINITLFKGEKEAYLILKDTGCGIPEKIKYKIFDPFFTTKGVDKGTGIGLALVNSFIEESNGKLSVESKVNVGTRFRVKLPLSLEESKIELTPKKESKNNITNSLKVLVVDDEPDLTEILQEQLEVMNCKVIVSNNGEEALNTLKNEKDIDIIFSDMQMPKMSGLELLRNIKNEDYNGKFYLMSGDHSHKYEGYKELLDGILEKPFNFEKIEKILNGK